MPAAALALDTTSDLEIDESTGGRRDVYAEHETSALAPAPPVRDPWDTGSSQPTARPETFGKARVAPSPRALTQLMVRGVRQRSAQEQPSVQIVKQWHGVVDAVDVERDVFWGRVLSGASAKELVEEEGLFPLSLVSDDDRSLVEVGAFFTYTVTRETWRGTRSNRSVLAFRRMPRWHLRQVADAKEQGLRFASILGRQSDLERDLETGSE